MKRPGIVTGLACLNLMGALSALWLFNARAHIGTDPIYLGSVFSVRWQWHWITYAIGFTFVTTVGLFRGWNWTRWLALVLCILGYIVWLPLRDVRGLPSFFFALAGSVLAFAILFFSPTVKRYFTRPTEGQRKFTIRGAISMTLLVFAVFTAHSIVMKLFWEPQSADVAWISVGVFFLPALLLNFVARWHLEVSLREISALLLAIAIFFANQLFIAFLTACFFYPNAVMRYASWLHIALLTLAFGAGGLLLTGYLMRRYRVAST